MDAESETLIPSGGGFDVAPCLRSNPYNNSDPTMEAQMLITHALKGEGHDASEDGTGRGTPLCVAPSLTASNDPSRSPQSAEVTQQVEAVYGASMSVRRLTPRECERLQGFPDDYTLVPVRGKPAADGPRYKALGNSMAVPVMNRIGTWIDQVEQIA